MNHKPPRQVANAAAAKEIVRRMTHGLAPRTNDVGVVYAIGVALTAVAAVALFAAMTGAA